MRICAVLFIAVMLFSCTSKGDPVLIGEPPEELREKLVYQSGHIPYYFPSREEFGDFTDGRYIGELNGGMIDSGKVAVTIQNGLIEDVEIIKITLWAPTVRSEGRLSEFYDGLPGQTIDHQSVRIDTVSAATGSSHVFKICLTRALWLASGKVDPMLEYSPY